MEKKLEFSVVLPALSLYLILMAAHKEYISVLKKDI